MSNGLPPLNANQQIVDTSSGVARPPFLLLINQLIGGFLSSASTMAQSAFDLATSLSTTKADKTTTIATMSPLQGGGDLSANRTLSLANSGVTAGTYGDGTHYPEITVDALGRVTSATQAALPAGSSVTVTDGTTSVAAVSKIKFTSGATVTNAGGGEADVAITGGGGGGGGSGGSGSELGHSFSNASNSQPSSTVTGGAPIPNMSVTFTLATATDVFFAWDILLKRTSGSIHIYPFIDGVIYQPQGTAGDWMAIALNENNMFEARGGIIVNLAAGSHTISLNYSDALTVNSVTFYSRYLRVEAAVVGSSGGITLISDTILSTNAANFTISSIPSTFTHLRLIAECRKDTGGITEFYVQFNGDTGNNYTSYVENRTGTANYINTARLGTCEAATATASVFALNEANFYNYASTTRFKTLSGVGFYPSISVQDRNEAIWRSTSAISSMLLYPLNNSFSAGTRFQLYGIS